MPYPVVTEPTWKPERTALCWLAVETTHPAPDKGVILEIGGCFTGWDLDPITWAQWIIRPPIDSWLDHLSVERRLVYEQNGLVDAVGRLPSIGASKDSGRYIADVNSELDQWAVRSIGQQLVPIIAGGHSGLMLRWLERYCWRLAARVHPVTLDTFGATHWGIHQAGRPDPCPDEPDGRVIPTVYRHLTTFRDACGMQPTAYPTTVSG